MRLTSEHKIFTIKNFFAAVICFILAISAKPAKGDVNMWPFLEVNSDTTTVLYPFYVNEEGFTMMFPFYYNTDNGKDHHLVWPFLKFSEGRLTRFAPFWFSGEGEAYTFFPFIWRTPGHTFWAIPPVYFNHDRDFFGIFPVYMTNSVKKYIFPNIYMKKKDGTDELEAFIFFPLYFYKNKDNIKKTNFGFLYGSERQEDCALSWLFPFYGKANTPYEKSLWIFPYYRKVTEQYDIKELFPFYYRKNIKISSDEIERTVWSLWPFYGKKETLSEEGRLLERKRRFLIFSDELFRDGIRKMKILGFPVRESFSAGIKKINQGLPI